MNPAAAAGPSALETLILSRREVARLMALSDWREAVEAGFRALADGRATAPAPMSLKGIAGTFHAKGATLRLGRPYAALKLNGNFPDNPEKRGLPTVQGAILLCDGETGVLLAIMDSIEVTLQRTAAATALAARHLARKDSRTILICGCGPLGRAHLLALREVMPLERLFAWDRDPHRSRRLAAEAAELGMRAATVTDLTHATASDIIVTCTTAREPFLSANMVAAGTFVAAVGADSPSKSEIDPALFGRALVVADSLEQCAAMGDLRQALLAETIDLSGVHAELAELVRGAKPGRTSEDQVTLFDSTGMAVQDAACAALLYERACADGAARSVALGAAS